MEIDRSGKTVPQKRKRAHALKWRRRSAECPHVTCKRCLSNDIQRSRRKGLGDKLKAVAGWWPYRCEDCERRFYARGRHLRPDPQPTQAGTRSAFAAAAGSEGPAMAFRADAVKPQAKVVIAADSHEQLNDILLALDRAVNSYQRKSQRTAQDERSYAAK